ncbi:MAG TPA: carboxypeptidase regulatory-like domain-containing protein [Thermoplasmata archaeon]|nr:carboxypeptidase regulatory-like domain-containing protein [Thermoplasmata archaeon]
MRLPWFLALGIWSIVGLVAAPVSSAPSFGSLGPASVPRPAPAYVVAPPTGTLDSARGLAGDHPQGESFVDVGTLGQKAAHKGLPLTAPAPPPVGGHGNAAAIRPPARPDVTPSSVTGNVTGNVLDSFYGTPVKGVNVTAIPLQGGACTTACGTATTDSSGGFSLTAPAGPVELLFEKLLYLENRSWITVVASRSVSVGTISLVHDGYAKGVVRYDAPGAPGAVGVGFGSVSRDGTVSLVGNASGGGGSFNTPVLPIPSRLDLTPRLSDRATVANFTWVNVSSYATVNLGTLFVENATPIQLTARDSVTGRAVAVKWVEVCSRTSLACLDNASAALPGPNVLTVIAPGYVPNATVLPDVPKRPVGGVFAVGTVELVPLGLINVTVGLTGGPVPGGAWTVGGGVLVECSMDGLTVPAYDALLGRWIAAPCTKTPYSFGRVASIEAPPLRDALFVGQPGGSAPVESESTSLSINGSTYAFAWSNVTWANVTTDRAVDLGYVNVTAGGYLFGRVAFPGSTPELFTVTACSTDEPRCESAVGATGTAPPPDPGCPMGAQAFCVPAPPGPVIVKVTARGSPGNFTWANVPPACCSVAGHPLNLGTINVSAVGGFGNVSGNAYIVTAAGGHSEPIGGLSAAAELCPAGPAPIGAACVTAPVDRTTGAFNATVPSGWTVVRIDAAGFEANWTWVDATGNNTTGDIYLATPAVLAGQVLIPGGTGITEAHVAACPIGGAPTDCIPLGLDGLTGTSGLYNGTVPGGPLPWGTYKVVATASGYLENFTWVNTTAGGLTVVPTLTLSPVGAYRAPGPTGRPHAAAAGRTSAAWVDGHLVDARTGLGLGSAAVTACPVAGGSCVVFLDPTNTGGGFNGSVAPGSYHLYLNESGYPTGTAFANATAAGVVHVGAVPASPWPAVRGRILIAPWMSVTTATGLGPSGASILICTQGGSPCGDVGFVDSGGFFNATAPIGRDQLVIHGGGSAAAAVGAAIDGFTPFGENLNLTTNLTQLATSGPSVALLPIDGGYVGAERDGSTWNSSLGVATMPVRFGIINAYAPGPLNAGAICAPGGGGNFAIFLPRGGSGTLLEAIGGAFMTANASFAGSIPSGVPTASPPIIEPHFGWVHATLRDKTTGAPTPFAQLTAERPDPANRTVFLGQGSANGAGIANVTAPPGVDSVFVFDPPYYVARNLTATVGESATTRIGRVNLTENPFPDTGAFFRTVAVNTVNSPLMNGVIDSLRFTPLPGAKVWVVNAYGSITNQPTRTNGLGQFFAYGPPPNGVETLEVRMPGYSVFASAYNLTRGGTVVEPNLNLTGDGVVAGSVVSKPTGAPVVNVTVVICPILNPLCGDATETNGSGGFWIAGAPGVDTLVVQAPGYLANQTVTVTVPSDGFVEVGAIPVYAYATLHGSVIGIPFGVGVAGANVSICSPLGTPYGPCFISVSANATGVYSIPCPPGTWVLRIAAPGFNTSYSSIAVLPGANVYQGVTFLYAYGSVYGTVVSASNGTVIAGATVVGCPLWSGSSCSGFATTNASGDFALAVPPGTVQLDASATGYEDNYTLVDIPAGGTIVLPSVNLTPLPSTLPIGLSGRVVLADAPTVGVAGAVVVVRQSGALVNTSVTDGQGRFSFTLYYGTFDLTAAFPGFHPVVATVVLHHAVAPLIFDLAVMTFPLTGIVRDRSSGLPVPGATIERNGTLVAVANGGGNYSALLANGTYFLSAIGPSNGSVAYAPTNFSVRVAGAPVADDIDLSPAGFSLSGSVVDGLSGLAIPDARLQLSGNRTVGGVYGAVLSAGGDGRFSLTLAPGRYRLTASAPGYATGSVPVNLTAAPGPLTIALYPVGGSPAKANLLGTLALPIVAAGILAVAAAVVILGRRRRAPPPPAPDPVDEIEPGEYVMPGAKSDPDRDLT